MQGYNPRRLLYSWGIYHTKYFSPYSSNMPGSMFFVCRLQHFQFRWNHMSSFKWGLQARVRYNSSSFCELKLRYCKTFPDRAFNILSDIPFDPILLVTIMYLSNIYRTSRSMNVLLVLMNHATRWLRKIVNILENWSLSLPLGPLLAQGDVKSCVWIFNL